VQEITTAAGVPKGTFYYHFDSQEALAAAALAHYWAGAAGRTLDLLNDPARPPSARLRHYFETAVAEMERPLHRRLPASRYGGRTIAPQQADRSATLNNLR
jgi:AcrR family transcriptional regulator